MDARGRAGPLAGRGLLLLALAGVVAWPAWATVREAWNESAVDVPTGVLRPLALARTTLALVGLTECLALATGIPLAFLLARTDLPGRRALLALMGIGLFVPLPLHAVAWLGAFGNLGRSQVFGTRPILVGLPGAAVVQALAALPWVVLLVALGLRAVEPELEEAARLDWPAWQVALRVSLRRAVGAVAAAALAVAVLTAGDMTITDLLVVRTFAEEAYTLSQLGLGQGAIAARVALPQLAVLGVLVLLGARALLRTDPQRLATPRARAAPWPLGRWRWPLGAAVLGLAGGAAGLPLYGLAWRAGRVGGSWSIGGLVGTLGRAWVDLVNVADPLDDRPLVGSLIGAALGATASVALAWPLAWLARRAGPWRVVAAASVALLLAAPGPVAGMALKLAYFDVPIIHDAPALLVIASVARTLPFALLILWPALRSLPDAYFDAAALDGLGPWGRAWRVALPLSRGAIVAAWAAAFALALGELPMAYQVQIPGRQPLAVFVWGLLHTGVESHLAGVGLILTVVTAAVGAGAAAALGRLAGGASGI